MIITRKSLSRRSLLKGIGAAIALPVLDAMTPALSAASRIADGAAPRRMAFMYVPNGIIMDQYTPATAGADFQLTRILEPLAAWREDFMVLSGLTLNGGRALGDGAGDHARAASSFLTSAHPVKTAGADIKAGVSVDQIAAQAVGNLTKFPSLELTCEDGRLVGNCDSGYSCAYSNSISWRTPSTPNPAEINPRAVFERLFGDADLDPTARAKRALYNQSILDFVSDDTRRLQGTLGSTDRRKLDEYLFAVREIEQRIQKAEKDTANLPTPSMERPAGVPVDFSEQTRLMFDLMVAAFQTDQTRIATFMIGREGSGRVYREIGISDAHHPLTHHRNNPDMVENVAKINKYHMEQFAYFLGKLKSTKDGDGTLLDHSMIVYGSGLSDGNRHQHDHLPVVLAGHGAGSIKPGRHIIYPAETPMANLYVSLLDRMNVKRESFGDSKAELDQLDIA
jgi:hypothetical protein